LAKIINIVPALLALLLIGCAGQFPPSGGPVDTTPPKIVSSYPTVNQINFDSREIRIEFDKYMVRQSVEGSIYFPPFDKKDLQFDWSGKEIDIEVKKPFDTNRTYILTIGARAQDTRGNYLGKAINIVFSTGAHVDTGMVTGRVYANKAQPYTVAAFPVTPDIDTLRPSECLPRYVTQSDDSGRYVLQGLANGKYRLICFDDQMQNFMYAPQVDLYSSATHDVVLTPADQQVGDVDFALGIEDTSRPQIYSVDMAADGLLLLKFSEPIDTAHLRPSFFVVRDSVTGDTIPVDFAARLESNEYNTVIQTRSPLRLHTKYFITATDSIKDLAQNPMSAGNNTIVIQPDSASVVVSPYFFSFADSLKGVTSYDTMFCQFVIPSMDGFPTNPEVSLFDSSGKTMSGFITRESPTMFGIRLGNLAPREWYAVKLRYRERDGGSEKDSVVTRRFMMADSTTLGDVEGTVTPVASGERIVVGAERQGGKDFYVFADSSGAFKLDGITAGTYTLRAFLQHGEGMKYYNGRSYPYRFAAPFGVYKDQVKVRARWTTEGIAIGLH
jgi:Bacterial Ig-like domain